MVTKQEDLNGLQRFTSDKGFEYIVLNGYKIRNSDSKKRIDEDEETFEEYKLRLKLLDKIPKRRSQLFWPSSRLGTYDKKKLREQLEEYNKNKQQLTEKLENGNTKNIETTEGKQTSN